MAKTVVPSKPNPPTITDQVEEQSVGVIRTAEQLASALGHLQQAATICKNAESLIRDINLLRQNIRDWKGQALIKTEGLGNDLAVTMEATFERAARSLDLQFLQLERAAQTIDLSATPADELPRF